MFYLQQAIYSFFCVVGFSVMFNLPKKLILAASLNGMVGWMLYIFIEQRGTHFIVPSLIGAICVGLLGELLAVLSKHPSTIFTIPGIIPFVPGYGIYSTMYYVVNQDYNQAVHVGAESFFIAIAIACDMVIATSFVRIVRPTLEKIAFKK